MVNALHVQPGNDLVTPPVIGAGVAIEYKRLANLDQSLCVRLAYSRVALRSAYRRVAPWPSGAWWLKSMQTKTPTLRPLQLRKHRNKTRL
jgi:hypothetical protein